MLCNINCHQRWATARKVGNGAAHNAHDTPKEQRLKREGSLLLVVRPGAPRSFLLLVEMPGAPSSVLAPSSTARSL